MVFFVCMSCQESLKGGKVPLHHCSGPFSCVDCSKDFTKHDVSSHNSCVSEAQKYQGGLYKPGKQKRDPQAEWMSCVVKKAKFHNFAAASLGCRDYRVLDEMFAAIEAVATATKEAALPPASAAAPTSSETPVDVSATPAAAPAPAASAGSATGKRRRTEDAAAALLSVPSGSTEPAEAEAAEAAEASGGVSKFRWKAAVLRAVRAAPAASLKASKLRRLTCDAAVAAGECEDAEAAFSAFDKRLAKLVSKGVVSEAAGYISVID